MSREGRSYASAKPLFCQKTLIGGFGCRNVQMPDIRPKSGELEIRLLIPLTPADPRQPALAVTPVTDHS